MYHLEGLSKERESIIKKIGSDYGFKSKYKLVHFNVSNYILGNMFQTFRKAYYLQNLKELTKHRKTHWVLVTLVLFHLVLGGS